MSASTITIRPGQLARCSPDFHITRGLTESHTLTLLDANSTAYPVTGITGWVMQVAQDFLSRTPVLAESETILSSTNVLPVTLNANTTELRYFMDGKMLSPVFASLIGLDSSGVAVRTITFRIAVLNSTYDPEAEPTPVQASQFYTAAQVDVKFAAIDETLHIPRDVADLTDADDLLASKIESVSALPTPAVGILNRSYFLTADDGTSKKGTTWKCVADGESYVFQQIQTDLNQLTDADNLLFDGDYDSLDNKPTIPTDLSTLTDNTGLFAAKENTANKATDFSTVNNVKFPTVQAVKDFAQNETLTELTGADVSVAPWTQSKWSASGVCSLTASGWAVSGHQVAYVLITLAAEATLSISGATVADDDALSAAGTYACYLVNENGTVRFRVANFTEAA